MMDIAMPLVVGALAGVTLLSLRSTARERHRAQLQHIRSSDILLTAHAEALQDFLRAPEAPASLKVTLMEFSDTLSHREEVIGIADFLASRRQHSSLPEEELAATDQITQLKSLSPALVRSFTAAVVTGTLAGLLRWPETAAEFETSSAQLFSDPQRDVATVVTVSRFRKVGLGLTVPPALAPA